MDYQKKYEQLISSRKILNRKKKQGIYYENHHIIPKCCGGSNNNDNLILLTSKEHYIAHLLLTKCYAGKLRSKMIYALWMLTTTRDKQKRPICSASQYATARALYIEAMSKRIVSPEDKEKKKKLMQDLLGGKKRPDSVGKNISAAKKGNCGKKLKGRTYDDIYGPEKAAEMREKRRNELKGKTYEEIHGDDKAKKQRQKLSKAHIGEKHSEERKKNYSEFMQKLWDEGKMTGMTGKKQTQETIDKRINKLKKSILFNNTFYSSLSDCALINNISIDNVFYRLNSKLEKHKNSYYINGK